MQHPSLCRRPINDKILYLCIMETFLESVAKVYYNNYQDDCHSLADVLFVFPGKRAGSFFLKSLKEEIKKTH